MRLRCKGRTSQWSRRPPASARASRCAATAHTVFPMNRERIRRISLRSAALPEPKGRRDKRMAEKREAQRRRRPRRPARPAWEGEICMDESPVPSCSPRGPLAERLAPRRALARDGSEGTHTSEGRTGGNEPAERHERATDPMLGRTGGVKCGMAYGARALGGCPQKNPPALWGESCLG